MSSRSCLLCLAGLWFITSSVVLPGYARADLLDALGDGLSDLGNAVGDAVTEGVKGGTAMASGKSQVKARYRLNGQTLTCFDGVKTAYILPRGATSPGAPGSRVTAFDCNKLANIEDVIVLPTQPAVGGGDAGGDTGYRDSYGTGCVTSNMTGDEIARNRNAIHQCQMDEVGEQAWQRSQARNRARSGARKAGADQDGEGDVEQIKSKAQKSLNEIQAQVKRDEAAARAMQRRARSGSQN